MEPTTLHRPAPTVREAAIELMRDFGMTTVFGNPGSTELPLFRDFPADFRYVLGLQESVVVGMADGYAQATRNAAFVNLHSAAGVGHAMGNIFTAHKNRTPLVITAGQQARAILPFDPFLYSNQATELPKPYVKWSCEPARAQDVPLAIARAYYVAMQEPRGPVLLSIPADDWDRETERVQPRVVSTGSRPEPQVLARIGDALDASERPAFVIGAAVDRGGAWDEAVALAQRHRARVYVAPMSGRCGFPEDHRLFAGFLPAMREAIVKGLEGHDLVFAIGAPHSPITSKAAERTCRPARHWCSSSTTRPSRRGRRWAPRRSAASGSASKTCSRGLRRYRAHCRRRARAAHEPSRRRQASGCRWRTCCRRWPRCATPTTSSSRRRRVRAR